MHNRLLLFTALILSFLMTSCNSTKQAGPVQYEYLQVERQGGGQLDFRIYPGESRSHLNIYVSSSNYQSVEERLILQIDEENVEAIDEFYQALNGQLNLKGKQPKNNSQKGTWLYLRFVRGNTVTEVTDPMLIQRFTVFESLVRDYLLNN